MILIDFPLVTPPSIGPIGEKIHVRLWLPHGNWWHQPDPDSWSPCVSAWTSWCLPQTCLSCKHRMKTLLVSSQNSCFAGCSSPKKNHGMCGWPWNGIVLPKNMSKHRGRKPPQPCLDTTQRPIGRSQSVYVRRLPSQWHGKYWKITMIHNGKSLN